jgi:hypothetical protein
MSPKRLALKTNGAMKKPKSKPKSSDSTTRSDNIDKLPLECIVETLKFLKSTYLNQLACCSKTCNEARNDSDLDQTQTGRLNVKTNGAAYANLNDAIVCGEWNNHPRLVPQTGRDSY